MVGRQFRARYVDMPILCVIHDRGAGRHAVRDHGTAGHHPVLVEGFDPVVVYDADTLGVLLAHPDHGPAAKERQHLQVVLVFGMDGPLGVRRQVAHRYFSSTGIARAQGAEMASQVERRPEGRQSFAILKHPLVIDVELLPTGEGAPGNGALHVDREG